MFDGKTDVWAIKCKQNIFKKSKERGIMPNVEIIKPKNLPDKLELSDGLKEILTKARKDFIPVALDDTIIFLRELIRKTQPKQILEIGTAIGYSGINMLLSYEKSCLTTIEYDYNRFCEAQQNFKNFGLSGRATQILGDAEKELALLKQNNKKYDFIFLDGPKGQYLAYLPLLVELLDDDGVLVADDVLFLGLVQGEEKVKHKHRTMIMRLRAYLDEINKNGLTSQIYDVGEGIAITRKIKE